MDLIYLGLMAGAFALSVAIVLLLKLVGGTP